MPKRTLFTNITPLPSKISRELAIAMVHNHDEMIELNPLVIEHHSIKTPRDAPADEFLECVWYEMTDKINYLPGGIAKGKVSYKGCFHDLPNGLQTHIYAPLGLDIREKWTIGGSLPGEPPEPRELGIDVPSQGLYIREEGDMRCNVMMSGFVRKNLDHAHKVLVERILKKAEKIEDHHEALRGSFDAHNPSTTPRVQPGSHLSNSSFIRSPTQPSFPRPTSSQYLPQQDGQPDLQQHPAFRNDHTPPPYRSDGQQHDYYSTDTAKQQRPDIQQPPPPNSKQFIAELPGSSSFTGSSPSSQSTRVKTQDNRHSHASELSGSEIQRGLPSPDRSSGGSCISAGHQHGQYKYNPQDFVKPQSGPYSSPPAQNPGFQYQQR